MTKETRRSTFKTCPPGWCQSQKIGHKSGKSLANPNLTSILGCLLSFPARQILRCCHVMALSQRRGKVEVIVEWIVTQVSSQSLESASFCEQWFPRFIHPRTSGWMCRTCKPLHVRQWWQKVFFEQRAVSTRGTQCKPIKYTLILEQAWRMDVFYKQFTHRNKKREEKAVFCLTEAVNH